jgi:hypothetical protein
MAGRPVAVPVLAKLVIKGLTSASRRWLGRRMAQMQAGALADPIPTSWPARPAPGKS